MTRAYDNAADARFPSGRRNLIINGNFDVWQRGTSFTDIGNGGFSADRWIMGNKGTGGTVNITQQAFTVGQTDVPGEPTYFCRVSQTVAGSDARDKFGQLIEDVRTAAGQNITISFYAKAATAKEFGIRVGQTFGSGGSTGVNIDSEKFTVGTSWQKFTFNISVPSITGKTIGSGSYLYVRIREYASFSTFDLDVSQFQVELGNIATPFEHRSYGEELALCQRYCVVQTNNSINAFPAYRQGGNNIGFTVTTPVPLRATPTISGDGATGNYQVRGGGANESFASASVNSSDGHFVTLTKSGLSHNPSSTEGYTVFSATDGTGFQLDAEL